jgi:hypothetical protein
MIDREFRRKTEKKQRENKRVYKRREAHAHTQRKKPRMRNDKEWKEKGELKTLFCKDHSSFASSFQGLSVCGECLGTAEFSTTTCSLPLPRDRLRKLALGATTFGRTTLSRTTLSRMDS